MMNNCVQVSVWIDVFTSCEYILESSWVVNVTLEETAKTFFQSRFLHMSLAIRVLKLCASNAGGVGLIPGWGTKIPLA